MLRRVHPSTLVLVCAVALLAGMENAAAPDPIAARATSEPAGRRLALGQSHTCAISADGALRCWGDASVGQLGTGTTETVGDDEAPADVPALDLGLGRRARAIAAGDFHTCAIVQGGAVLCWGWNRFGQLGYARTDDLGDDEPIANLPAVDLGPGRAATALAAGANFTCALLDDGSVRCWGGNIGGQLGQGNTANIGDDEKPGSVPAIPLGPGRRAVGIAAGGFHACAVLDDGELRCWGSNAKGELGLRTTASLGDSEPAYLAPPVNLGPGPGTLEVDAGFSHTCALRADGEVRCWGDGSKGALGLGVEDVVGDDETPASVPAVRIERASAMSAGAFHTCALLEDGRLRCWGSNSRGQLGNDAADQVGNSAAPDTFAAVSLPARVVEVAAGGYHTCARTVDDRLYCWGANDTGQLGFGAATPKARSGPGLVRGLEGLAHP